MLLPLEIGGAGNESCELLEPGDGTDVGFCVFFFDPTSTD
jgi:hypothetical protein